MEKKLEALQDANFKKKIKKILSYTHGPQTKA